MGLVIGSEEAGGIAHNSFTSPLTWSFNNVAGTLLVVMAEVNNNTAATCTLGVVSYGGVAMAQIPGSLIDWTAGGVTDNKLALYSLVNPPTGAHTVSIAASGSFIDIIGAAISFRGQAASPLGTAQVLNGSSAAAALTLSGTTVGSYVVSGIGTGTLLASATAPTIMSAFVNASVNDAGDNAGLAKQAVTAGSTNAAFTVTNDQWSVSAVEIFAAPAPPLLMPQVLM
jgi:hypothetical protein